MTKDKCMEFLRVELTKEEVYEFGRELARKNNELGQIEVELQAVKAQFKERQTRVESSINTLSRLVSNGYDHRDVECLLVWNKPKNGVCTIVRPDTGEEVRTRIMTLQESQELLPFVAEDVNEDEEIQGTVDILNLVDEPVTAFMVKSWTGEQVEEAEEWASKVYSRASDNNVKVPPRPKFLDVPVRKTIPEPPESELSPSAREAVDAVTRATEGGQDLCPDPACWRFANHKGDHEPDGRRAADLDKLATLPPVGKGKKAKA